MTVVNLEIIVPDEKVKMIPLLRRYIRVKLSAEYRMTELRVEGKVKHAYTRKFYSSTEKASQHNKNIVFTDCTTKALVEEIMQREGVEYKIAEPYTDESISANGPAILLKVID